MLARKNLLALKKEFPRLRREGKTYPSESFGLIVSYGSSTIPQAAFIVSKKISLKSVVRHQVKRKLADAVQPLLPRLPKNLELVFLAKPQAIAVSPTALQSELLTLLRRIKILSP